MRTSDLDPAPSNDARLPGRARTPLFIAGGVALVLLLGGLLFYRQTAEANTALEAVPKGVTVEVARAASFRAQRRYIGTIHPWVEAHLGTQFTSAYIDTVLVRPGAVVKRGQVVATLDCRNASAESKAVAMQARALEAKQEALAHEATRVEDMLHGGFVSPNEAELKSAETSSKAAELLATRAKLMRASLEVNDCILRAPFDGEVADRMNDPGAFARPGTTVVTIVDRSTVRVTADVPESDFEAVTTGTPVRIRMLAGGRQVVAKVARRSPAADLSTRTIHFEIDIPDPERTIPVGTTAELTIDVGKETPAIEIPLQAASIRGTRATVFVIEGDRAHKAAVGLVGELAGKLYVDASLKAGAHVVTEGRAALKEGDQVTFQVAATAQTTSSETGATPVEGGPRERVAAPAAAGISAKARL